MQSGGTGEGEDPGARDSAGLTPTPASLRTLVPSSLLTRIQHHPPPVHQHPLLGISETEEPYKKDFHDTENHDDVISHLESDILE